MDRLFRLAFIPFLLLVAACSTPTAVIGTIPAPAPGTAQIVFYRDIGYYDPADVLTVSLNGRSVVTLPRGDVVYRDVPPGTYTVAFKPTRPFPDQFKTFTVAPGEVTYVKIEPLPEIPCAGTLGGDTTIACDISGFTSVVIDPVLGRQEIRGLRLVQD